MMFQSFNSCGMLSFNHHVYDNYNFATHLHRNTEFLYVLDGSISITVNNKKEHAAKGQYALIPPFHMHSFETTGSSKVWVGVFSNDFFDEFTAMMNKKTATKFVFNSPDDVSAKLLKIHELSILKIKSVLYGLCGDFADSADLIDADSANYDLVVKIMHYISENLTENITLNSLAEHLNYEKHYISKIFNSIADMNFRHFLNMCRIEIAKDMLKTTSNSITETAHLCGYSNLRTFNRAFREFMNCTPNQYRKDIVDMNTSGYY